MTAPQQTPFPPQLDNTTGYPQTPDAVLRQHLTRAVNRLTAAYPVLGEALTSPQGLRRITYKVFLAPFPGYYTGNTCAGEVLNTEHPEFRIALNVPGGTTTVLSAAPDVTCLLTNPDDRFDATFAHEAVHAALKLKYYDNPDYPPHQHLSTLIEAVPVTTQYSEPRGERLCEAVALAVTARTLLPVGTDAAIRAALAEYANLA